MPPKIDVNKAGWEEQEFPSVCENCLSLNPYVRMTREGFGAECKICTRPFTVFRWQPAKGVKPKRTEICGSCARLKNCCQTCILDLQFGLPLAIRDAALKMIKNGPTSDINREYHAQNEAQLLKAGESGYDDERVERAAHDLLRKLAKSEPYFRRSRPQIDEKEARQLLQKSKDIAVDNGERSLLETVVQGRKGKIQISSDMTPPADKSISSLFLLGVDDDLPEYKIKAHFAQFGPLKSVVCSHRARCAFVNFKTRAAAELAAESCRGGELVIEVHPLKVQWSKPRPIGTVEAETQNQRMAALALQSHSVVQERRRKRQRALAAIQGDTTAVAASGSDNDESETTETSEMLDISKVPQPAGSEESGAIQYHSQQRKRQYRVQKA